MLYAFYSSLRRRLRPVLVFSYIAVTALLIFGCGMDKLSTGSSPAPINPAVEFVDHSGCMMTADKSPDDLEKCIAIEYDGSGELRLVSIGSWFNCCPDSLEGAVTFHNRTIYIVEIEYMGPMSGCDCLCTYDFTYRLSDLPPGDYSIVIETIPPYPWESTVIFEAHFPAYPFADTLCQDMEVIIE